MEKIESLQEKIDKTEYWDMKILDFQINFLGDEVQWLSCQDKNLRFL